MQSDPAADKAEKDRRQGAFWGGAGVSGAARNCDSVRQSLTLAVGRDALHDQLVRL